LLPPQGPNRQQSRLRRAFADARLYYKIVGFPNFARKAKGRDSRRLRLKPPLGMMVTLLIAA
jgi:hypothetical protein